MNIFHFSRSPGDFSIYDISACYEDSHKLHLMVRIPPSTETSRSHFTWTSPST